MHVSTSHSSYARLKTLPLNSVQITGGFWGKRQKTNRETSLHHGYRMLEQAGNFNNLRLAAGAGTGEYQGFLFNDSDVYKWLEAAVIELANQPDAGLEQMADQAIAILADAQQSDGYLNSYFTTLKSGERWMDLDHGHELYCAGHLFEAAVSHHRATGKNHLLDIACRYADCIDRTFGPGKREAACGHPEVELALVELYRETGERRYLNLASFFIDQRGKGRMKGYGTFGPEYHQDRVPVRAAQVVEGHAVRQLYLNAGVTDIYLETGEPALLSAMQRLWQDMTAYKTYLTGGFGSRGNGEAFGDAYELPSRGAYCETCAAIAAMMWNWRMLLATGEARFADLLERSLYNGFISGVALDGTHFFYTNPLESEGEHNRVEWFPCACCPPNLMRQIALVGNYLATTDPSGVQIHQYASARIEAGVNQDQKVALRMETDYPWDGKVKIILEEAGGSGWHLALRLPSGCQAAQLSINGSPVSLELVNGSYLVMDRAWRAGDEVELNLEMTPHLVAANPGVGAVRNCLAVQRGPLVYCFEQADQEAGREFSQLRLSPAGSLRSHWNEDLLGGIMQIEMQGLVEDPQVWIDHLYQPVTEDFSPAQKTRLAAIPYYAWANRGPGKMRVWMPTV
ncbi:MAG: glycoside hydrolase family 127 protein [Omnitrophica WOR_2 bacterium]